jgi:hypothetical protein
LHGHDRASEETKGLIPRGLLRKPPQAVANPTDLLLVQGLPCGINTLYFLSAD